MILDFLTPSGTTMPIEVEESSNVYRSVSEGNRFEFTIKCETPITLPLGSTVKVEGYTYTLFYPLECRKENTEHYVHSGMMHGEEEALKMVKIKDAGQEKPVLSFVLTGKPIDFVRFVAKSMGSDWQVGDVVDGAVKTLAFKHEYCWDAIRRVCEEYQTEFRVEGKTIHLRKLELNKDNPLPLSYGMGKGFLPGVGVRSDTDTQRIGRLFVEGSSRNINPSTYGAMTLQLPKSATFEYEGTTYSTDETGSFIKGKYYGTSLAEESFDGTEIYPCREGAVSKAETTPKGFVDFFDDSIPEALNFNDYRIPGEKAMVVFLSGMLQGREFEIAQTKDALTGYKHEERRFQLVPSEQDGFTMPGGIYMPAVGDRYAIYGISLPPTYTEKASMELFHEGCKFLHKLETSRFKFDGKLDPSYTHAKWLEIGGKVVPGSYILFSDPDIFPKGEKIRVVAIQHPIDRPFAAELTLTNASEGGYIGNQLGKLAAESILRKQEQRSQQRSQRQDYRQALEHIGMVEKAVEGIEGFSKRIKPSVVETMSVLVGSQATQFDFVERYGSMTSTNVAVNYDTQSMRVMIPNAFIRHQSIGITSITNARKSTDYRYWSVARYTSPALTDMEQSYYIYAKAECNGKGGNYLLSEEPLPFDASTHYHLLIGTLSSVIDGDRAYNRLYGFSMVTPGQILTDTISSANGRMRIDLDTGEIISDVIKFRRPDGREQGVDEAIDEIDTHQPIIKDGTWWRWDGEKYVDTGEPARGQKGDRGERGATGERGLQGLQGAKGDRGQDAVNFDMGRMLHTDPTFMEGYNEIYRYDNARQGAVTVTRIARPADCPTTSSHALQVHFDSTIASVWPGIGGFVQYTNSRANAIFVHRFIANVPAGYKLNWAGNPIGVGGSHKWVTPNAGTGKYEEYICVTYCGSSGTFSDFGYMYLTGARATMDVIIAYATMYDMTDAPDYYAKIAEAKQATVDLKTYTDGAFADGIISQTEAKAIATYKQQVNESWASVFAEYERVYANTLLSGTPKTTLLNSKVSLSGAKDQLLSAITSAIADGKATTSEAANVDTKYNAYNSALSAFQKALEDAREAIRKGGHAIRDTRNDNQPPSWYRENYRYTTVKEFKLQKVIEIPSDWRDGSYCTLETTVNWGDTSGGRVTQKATLNSGLELYRNGTADDSAWEAWSNTKAEVQAIQRGLSNANTLIATLEKTAEELKKGKLNASDLPDVQYLLDSLQKGSTQIAGGLLLTNDIILSSPSSGKVTAALSGSAAEGHKALRLGIVDTLQEMTALRNDGTGHIGQLHFNSDRIVVAPINDLTQAFMEFGRNVMRQTIQDVLRNNGYDNTANLGSMGVTSGSEIKRKTFDVVNDGTLVTITMTLTAEEQYHTHGSRREFESVYKITNAYLDGETNLIDSAFSELDSRDIGPHGGGQVYYYPEKSEKVSYTVRLPKGQHTISIKTNFGAGSATGIKVRQVYTTNYRQTSFSDRGMRIYGGGDSYVDFNHDHPQGTTFATIGGGLKVDYIDTSGAVLAGAQFDIKGGMVRQFGRYCKKQKQQTASAYYDYTNKRITVYHSIGHTNYVPMITISEANSARTATVTDIFDTSFRIQIFSGWDKCNAAFSYVAFKSD